MSVAGRQRRRELDDEAPIASWPENRTVSAGWPVTWAKIAIAEQGDDEPRDRDEHHGSADHETLCRPGELEDQRAR